MTSAHIFRVLPGNRWVEVTPSPSGGFTADVHDGAACVGMTAFKTTEAALLWAATQHPKQAARVDGAECHSNRFEGGTGAA